MEKHELENKSNLCRVCLEVGEYDIYNGAIVVNSQSIQIDVILKEFTSLDLENLDVDSSNTPRLICGLCTDKLIQCYQFIQQIQQADDYIMKLINNYYEKTQSENEQHEIEEYTVHIVDECDVVEKQSAIQNHKNIETPTRTKLQRKRKINNTKKPNLVLTENVSNILSHVSENCDDIDDEIVDENMAVNKKKKITNVHNSIEDIAFVITKFIPSETISTTHTTENIEDNISNQTEESISNHFNNDIIKSQNIIRTYDLAAVEIDPTDEKQFDKLLEKYYDEDDDENDDDDNDDDDTNSGAVYYACQYCPRAFSSSQFLKQHIRKTHVCQFCMKGFEKSAQLFEHIRNNHSQFNCPFCQKSYKTNGNLRQHMKKIHTFRLPAHTSLLAFSKKDESILSSNGGETVE